MKPRVYVETSVLSYLTSWPSRDLVKAAHQEVTSEWWAKRERFDLFVSETVLAEVGQGDPEAARLRLAAAAGLPALSGGHMIADPIVEEVHAIRDEIAKEHGYDIDAIFQTLRRLDETSAAEHVTLPARRVTDQNETDSPLGGEAA